MRTRLAHQLALIAAMAVLINALRRGSPIAQTVEQVLVIGTFCWIIGLVLAEVLNRLSVEYMAVLAGRTAEVADEATKSPDRISARNSNN